MTIIGIDLGSKYSRICTYKDEETILIPNQFGNLSTHSIVHITQEGYVLVGESAFEKLYIDSDNTVADFKSYLGTDHEFILQGKSYKAYELYGFILNQLKIDAKLYLGEDITTVTMSVPLHFDEKQRANLKMAAKLAGLNVDYFVNEPSAVALSFIDSNVSLNKFLILDVGASFKATVIDFYRDLIEIVSHSNDLNIGCDTINTAIRNYFIEQTGFTTDCAETEMLLQKQIEIVKKNIYSTIILDDCSLTFNKEVLQEICQPIFDNIKVVISQALNSAGLHANEIVDVILVGGVARFEVFYDYISTLFECEPQKFNEPQFFVINGITLHNALKEDDILNIRFTDLCPYSFGVSVKNNNGKFDKTDILIGKNMPLPMVKTKQFIPVRKFQDKITFKICQGDNYYTKDNTVIDSIELDVNPKESGVSFFEITLYYSIEGILEIEISHNYSVVYKNIIISEHLVDTLEELELKIEKLEQVADSSLNQKIDDLRERLNSLYSKNDLFKKRQIGELFSTFDAIFNNTRLNEVARNLAEFERKIGFWENSINDPFAQRFEDIYFDNDIFEDIDELEVDLINFDIFDDIDEFDDEDDDFF